MKADITTSILGIKLHNPTILASGIMGVSGASCVYAAKNGAGAIIPKSIGPVERQGHNNPVITQFESGFLNAVGLPNAGVDNSLDEIRFAMDNAGVPVFPSFFGTTIEEFGFVAEKLSSINPLLMEVNLSSPTFSVPGFAAKQFALNKEDAASAIREIKSRIKVPIMVKLAPNVPDIKEIAKAVEEAGADAISATNTMPGMMIDAKVGKPILHNKSGGISGPALKPIALKCVYDIYSVVDIPIVGIGGVKSGQDAVEMIMAGAVAVQIGSGIYYRGIDVFKKVSDEMAAFMVENGYSRIKDMVGIAHK